MSVVRHRNIDVPGEGILRLSSTSLLAERRAHQREEAEMATNTDRNKSLELALAQIDKQFGKGSIMRLGDDNRSEIQVIPTGSLALDVALGCWWLAPGAYHRSIRSRILR